MKNKFKNTITEEIRKKYDEAFYIDDCEWEETVEQVMQHLLANEIYFFKDARFEDFVKSIWQYIQLIRTQLK